MTVTLDIHLTAPLPLGDLVAELRLVTGQTQRIVLREGRFHGELAAEPQWLKITDGEPPPADEAPSEDASPDAATRSANVEVVAYEELFESGRAISSGSVRLELIWGLHCHQGSTLAPKTTQELHPESAEGKEKFVAWEHLRCAELVGKDAGKAALVLADGPLGLDAKSELPVGPGGLLLTFGQIIAVAGDYYAHLDDQAAEQCGEAWPLIKGLTKLAAGDYTRPTLSAEDPAVVKELIAIAMRDRDQARDKLTEISMLARDGLFGRYPVRRYLALASQNFCHFATPPGTPVKEDVGALRWYNEYHGRALAQAEEAGRRRDREALKQALVSDAFGCHFLTDLFATGHMRVPRRILGERLKLWRGSLGCAHEMHCEDNKLGLWCTTQLVQQPRRVWLAYGDAMLFSEQSEKQHLKVVQEAVRRSFHEVVARYDKKVLAPAACAAALIPVPLPAGESPTELDVLPLQPNNPTLQMFSNLGPNHYPLIVYLRESDLIARRCGSPDVNVYRDVADRLPEYFSIDFSAAAPTLGEERIPRLK